MSSLACALIRFTKGQYKIEQFDVALIRVTIMSPNGLYIMIYMIGYT